MKRDITEAQLDAKAEAQRFNRLCYDLLGKDQGVQIMEKLAVKFELRSMIKKGKDGRVDPFQTLANNGAYECYSFLKQCIEFGSKGK